MALNERSGLFAIEVGSFALVAGYLVYKWNTTPTLGSEIEGAAGAVGDYLGGVGTTIGNDWNDFVNSFENGLSDFFGGKPTGPAYPQVTVGLAPDVYHGAPGYQAPPPILQETGYGIQPSGLSQPGTPSQYSQSGPRPGDVYTGEITPDVQAQLDAAYAQIAASPFAHGENASENPVTSPIPPPSTSAPIPTGQVEIPQVGNGTSVEGSGSSSHGRGGNGARQQNGFALS